MITKAAETEALKTVKTEEKPVLQTEKKILPGQPEAYSEVKGRIVPALISRAANREFLQDKPFLQMEDLAVTYRVSEIGRSGIRFTPVTRDMFRSYGVSLEELHLNAVTAMKALMPAGLRLLEELVGDSMGDRMLEMKSVGSFLEEWRENGAGSCGKPIVLSNRILCGGAAAILDPETADALAEAAGTDYLIIPSSVHELIVIPRVLGEELGRMRSMVRRVNRTMVDESDVLSDHIYTYDYSERRLKIAQ